MSSIKNRYDFVLFAEVKNGNPNGDPDAGNMPRMDIETGIGNMTSECISRQIRNYISVTRAGVQGYDIYVAENSVLNLQNKQAYDAIGLTPEAKRMPKDEITAREITKFMCDNFFDVRAFGAVMTTEVNCGSVKGPVRIFMAESIDPINPRNLTVTRVAVTTEKEKDDGKDRMMGSKYIVPYALYRIHGTITVPDAEKTGFSEEDVEVLWEALENMFEYSRSASRGFMASRKLIIFEHENRLGNAHSHKLFESVTVEKTNECGPARSYQDYKIDVDKKSIPDGVIIVEQDF